MPVFSQMYLLLCILFISLFHFYIMCMQLTEMKQWFKSIFTLYMDYVRKQWIVSVIYITDPSLRVPYGKTAFFTHWHHTHFQTHFEVIGYIMQHLFIYLLTHLDQCKTLDKLLKHVCVACFTEIIDLQRLQYWVQRLVSINALNLQYIWKRRESTLHLIKL